MTAHPLARPTTAPEAGPAPIRAADTAHLRDANTAHLRDADTAHLRDANTAHLRDAIQHAACGLVPYRHAVLQNVLPARLAADLRALAYAPSPPDGSGTRAGANASRIFGNPEAQASHRAWACLAAMFQNPEIGAALAALSGATLSGSFLRIEYCLDTEGFWLEPHTDIGDKLFTLVLSLSDQPGAEAWGTDILYPDGRLATRIQARPNSALVFAPAPDTWHGFARRPIHGIRRTLIVNYVRPVWRARHELCFPDQPLTITASART